MEDIASSHRDEPDDVPQAAETPTIETPTKDAVAELERLATLKEKGMLSDGEFAAAKAKVLGKGDDDLLVLP